jgi:hypothetical protein
MVLRKLSRGRRDIMLVALIELVAAVAAVA